MDAVQKYEQWIGIIKQDLCCPNYSQYEISLSPQSCCLKQLAFIPSSREVHGKPSHPAVMCTSSFRHTYHACTYVITRE